jgi:hypothetical protein
MPSSGNREKILQAERKISAYLQRQTSDLLAETLKARKRWNDIFQVLSVSNCKPRTVYPVKLFLKINGEIKSFQDKLQQCITSGVFSFIQVTALRNLFSFS